MKVEVEANSDLQLGYYGCSKLAKQWRRQGGGAAGARAPAVKPCAPAVPRQLSYSDVDHKRISCLRATDYSEDINYDVIINHAE